MDNNLKIIYELLKEVRKDQKEQSKELAEQSKCLVKMESSIKKNTEDLAIHIKRTEQNEYLISANTKRICNLEEPVKINKIIYRKYFKIASIVSISLGIISTIIFTITKFI